MDVARKQFADEVAQARKDADAKVLEEQKRAEAVRVQIAAENKKLTDLQAQVKAAEDNLRRLQVEAEKKKTGSNN